MEETTQVITGLGIGIAAAIAVLIAAAAVILITLLRRRPGGGHGKGAVSYCSQCGKPLTADAQFCPSCGARVARRAGAQPESAPQGAGRGGKKRLVTILIAGGAAVIAAVLLIVLLWVRHENVRAAEFGAVRQAQKAEATPGPTERGERKLPESTPDSTDAPAKTTGKGSLTLATARPTEAPAEPQSERTGNAELDALLADYQDIINTVLDGVTDSWAADYNCGYMYDYDSDGYPELVALYCQDGVQLHALVARRLPDGTPRVLDQYVCPLAGGANATIYSGYLANVPMIHIVYENYDGDTAVGRDTVLALAESDLELMYNLTWEESMDGSSITHLVGGEEDEALFRMVYGARDYYECSFPSDEHVPLDGVIEEYLSWGRGE